MLGEETQGTRTEETQESWLLCHLRTQGEDGHPSTNQEQGPGQERDPPAAWS